jgi:general secretion pathway protein D
LSTAPVLAADNSVNLDFANADLPTVIHAVSKMTGKTLVVDPRVKGTLNLVTPKPVSKAQAYELLLAALRLQGYAVVNAAGVLRVLPEADAKFHAVPVSSKKGAGANGEIVSRVFRLQHESATSLVTVLRPLVSPNNVVTADPGSNSLLITDYADNLGRLAAVIDSLDVPSTGEPLVIPLKHAAAQDVANLIGKVFATQAGPGNIGNERVDVAVDARSNSLVVSSDNPARLARVKSLVASLDQPSANAGNVHVIYLKNAEATRLAQVLRGILGNDGGASAYVSTTPSTPTTPASATSATSGASGNASSASNAGSGMIVADAASNALIITAPEAQYQNIKAAIDKLDVRRAQVLVEAMIVEMSADKAAEFGIQWMFLNGLNKTSVSGIGGFGSSSTSSNIGNLAANPTSALSGFSLGVMKGTVTLPDGTEILNLGVLARALETTTNANVLSTPTLLALDNEEAKISVGSNVPFQTGQYSISSGSSASPFTTYERKDVGLTLKIKPQISEGGTVRLQIYEEVSKLRTSAEATLAITDKRSLESTVLVDDGQIVVLGGLIENSVQDVEDRVPLLGDLPLLGHLFRYNTRANTKTNLMVFLRPLILRDADAASKASNPRYQELLGLQQQMAPVPKFMLPDVDAPKLKLDAGLAASATPTKP